MKTRAQYISNLDFHMSLKEIAAVEKVSYQRVEQIINGALVKLHRAIKKGYYKF